ncbi:hypothetical protein NP233_g4223 [Leucocoprinus birnbaumii]|uniref:Uncharacterized protein n=1 Tax=Leucocoprinus birnbaumii TaxID=56174 RepID=A0AAD5VXT3_9AGAR|nr:hypothetical protein NP233_g4223 [Leucocoprinus birnbaumii]
MATGISSTEETASGTTLCDTAASSSTSPRRHLPPITGSSLEAYASEHELTSIFIDDDEMSPFMRFI